MESFIFAEKYQRINYANRFHKSRLQVKRNKYLLCWIIRMYRPVMHLQTILVSALNYSKSLMHLYVSDFWKARGGERTTVRRPLRADFISEVCGLRTASVKFKLRRVKLREQKERKVRDESRCAAEVLCINLLEYI